MKYSSVPLELYPSKVFHQAVFHVLGECWSYLYLLNLKTYPCSIIPSRMTQFEHPPDQCEVIRPLSCLLNHQLQSVLFIQRVFTGVRTKTDRLSDQTKLILILNRNRYPTVNWRKSAIKKINTSWYKTNVEKLPNFNRCYRIIIAVILIT